MEKGLQKLQVRRPGRRATACLKSARGGIWPTTPRRRSRYQYHYATATHVSIQFSCEHFSTRHLETSKFSKSRIRCWNHRNRAARIKLLKKSTFHFSKLVLYTLHPNGRHAMSQRDARTHGLTDGRTWHIHIHIPDIVKGNLRLQ